MDRFPTESVSDFAANHARYMARTWGEDTTPRHNDETGCLNCGKTGVELTLVPGFDYMGCDDCRAEAEAIIAKEAAELELNAAIVAALSTHPMGIAELADAVQELVKISFVDLCMQVNRQHAIGKLVSVMIDEERIYSLVPARMAPGSVVWGDIQQEVA